jgi:hypothetical protein
MGLIPSPLRCLTVSDGLLWSLNPLQENTVEHDVIVSMLQDIIAAHGVREVVSMVQAAAERQANLQDDAPSDSYIESSEDLRTAIGCLAGDLY